MEIHTFHLELATALEHSDIHASTGTLSALAGGEIRTMALCYLEDGRYCMDRDDPVNALASFAYAAGWLDAGCYIGIIPAGHLCRYLLTGGPSLPDRFHHQLLEKTTRYQRILDSAITSSVPAPENGIHWYDGAERVFAIATAYLAGGGMFLRECRLEDSLACFSYGHGWLDAALRVGLVRITGNRDLFAI